MDRLYLTFLVLKTKYSQETRPITSLPFLAPSGNWTTMSFKMRYEKVLIYTGNKANLRDLIAATCLVILLNLDLNRRFFTPCDLDIWWMTQKNNRAPLLCYFKLFASFRSHWWIQTGVTVRKRLIWVKIDAFFSPVTLKFDGWPS